MFLFFIVALAAAFFPYHFAHLSERRWSVCTVYLSPLLHCWLSLLPSSFFFHSITLLLFLSLIRIYSLPFPRGRCSFTSHLINYIILIRASNAFHIQKREEMLRICIIFFCLLSYGNNYISQNVYFVSCSLSLNHSPIS